jgi:divalent metal cation (Fe/Co/Zn/Cd) transporter
MAVITSRTADTGAARAPFVKRAVFLSMLTIGYNAIEGIVSVYFGVTEESFSLAGFGMDSFIEVASAFLVLWRLRAEVSGEDGIPLERERKATLGIGTLFLLLAVVIAAGGGYQLLTGDHPATTIPGLIIALVSICLMLFLYRAKKKTALVLDSSTVMKDAGCTLACFKLSVILFAGSLLFIVSPSLWWADSVAALALSLFIGQEGLETVKAARHADFSGGCGCPTD